MSDFLFIPRREHDALVSLAYQRRGFSADETAQTGRENVTAGRCRRCQWPATEDPHEVAALLPFGGHKGYGICLLNEIFGGLIGGSLKRRKKFQCFRFSSHPPRGSRW